MPLEDNLCENKLTNEKIDFDFYDSVFETDDTCDEETNLGVKKVQIKPIQEKSSNSDLSADTDSGNKDLFINNSDCDLEDNLTKCIAYETNSNNGKEVFEESYAGGFSDGDISPTLGSSLSESTPSSDLTNVSPLTTSSSYSSLKDKLEEDSCSLNEESSKGEMKLLADAVKTLSLQSKPKRRSAIPVSTNRQLPNRSRRKNMTFTNDELRKIDRENEILLKKIMSHSKPRSKTVLSNNTTPPRTIKASAAVNRSKKQREINRDNYILLKKIHNAKPTQSCYHNQS